MQIGPKEGVEGSIEEYVEKKRASESERKGTLTEHYGYPRPFTQSPSSSEIEKLHDELKKTWGGEIPSLLDPTAGGGIIPFESIRYGLPTNANELNPIPTLILKTLLQFAPEVGSLNSDVQKWSDKIHGIAKENLDEYFPNKSDGYTPDSYASTYLIDCPSCGSDVPLVPKWRVRAYDSGKDIVAKPELTEDGSVNYECLTDPSEEELGDFDPLDGPVSRGGNVECLRCGVVTESDDVKEKLSSGEFCYDIYAVKYLESDGKYGYRAPTDEDREALSRAEDRVNNYYELSTILDHPIPDGEKTREPQRYGIKKWRDLFTPRQLLSHYEHLQATKQIEEEIRAEHSKEEADAIITLLSFVAGKMLDNNSKLSPWATRRGCPGDLFRSNHFGFTRVFADNNLSAGSRGYKEHLRKILEAYEEIVTYVDESSGKATITTKDAADIPYETGSIQSVVIDPPYYSSVMYAELSDYFYVWFKEYLGDVYPDLFEGTLTNKDNEAVANPSKFSEIAKGKTSKSELAKSDYEEKMGDIFSELYRVLEPGGVMTVMFTHKETDAWDTLTMSLINSGFVITSTHPITSEMPQRAGMRDSASADSTLLLTGRKPHEERDPDNAVPTLWSDVESDTRKAAKEAARDLLESGISLTKTDVIISAFGPTLRVFADAYPVVDDQDEEVPPRKALETAREAVTQILVDEYLEGMDVENLDDVTEWYILCWLVHEAETFSYDDGRQLGLGIGVDIDEIKRSTKTWRKSRGDISLRGHDGRVQNINEKPEDRSSRLPVDPDDLSFPRSLDAVHAAMHVYRKRGETETIEWLRERKFDSDSQFKATLKALLQVLPHNHEDWELARDLAVGRTRDFLDLDFSPSVFADKGDETTQSELTDH
jgi:adenine-specific DNA methylase